MIDGLNDLDEDRIRAQWAHAVADSENEQLSSLARAANALHAAAYAHALEEPDADVRSLLEKACHLGLQGYLSFTQENAPEPVVWTQTHASDEYEVITSTPFNTGGYPRSALLFAHLILSAILVGSSSLKMAYAKLESWRWCAPFTQEEAKLVIALGYVQRWLEDGSTPTHQQVIQMGLPEENDSTEDEWADELTSILGAANLFQRGEPRSDCEYLATACMKLFMRTHLQYSVKDMERWNTHPYGLLAIGPLGALRIIRDAGLSVPIPNTHGSVPGYHNPWMPEHLLHSI